MQQKNQLVPAKIFAIRKFEEASFNVIVQDNDQYDLWFTGEEIGQALGLSEPRKNIHKIFARHKDELEEFSGIVNLTTPGGIQETRIYSEEGLYLITLFSKSPKGKTFRKWVIQLVKSYRENFFILKPAPLLPS